MFPVTRIYESEHTAIRTADLLVNAGIGRGLISVIHASDPDAAAKVDAAVDKGNIRSGHRRALKAALTNGRSVVSAAAGFGWGSLVENTMARGGPVDSHTLPDYKPSDPSLFSDMLGWPVLSHSKPRARLSLFNSKSSFGFKLLSNNPTPLSSLFGLKVLTSSKGSIAKGSSVERMSGTAAPFSSRLGLKLLTSKRGSRAKGSSVERMSDNPAPFSSFVGLPVLRKRK